MSTSAVSSALLGVSSSSSTTSTDTSSTSDEFLTLFIAELKNQDPTNAVDTSELTSQLATFTQVEQSIQTNLYLDTLTQYAASVNNAEAASCIGKTVSVDTSEVAVSDGDADDIVFSLSDDAANATITISDSSGNVINTITETNLSEGDQLRLLGRNGQRRQYGRRRHVHDFRIRNRFVWRQRDGFNVLLRRGRRRPVQQRHGIPGHGRRRYPLRRCNGNLFDIM